MGTTFSIELSDVESPAAVAKLETDGPAVVEERGTVLYIEDNISNLALVQGILERRPGISLITAMQGRFGIDLARNNLPDVILLDLNLPDIGGDEVQQLLRNDVRTAPIPVIMLSADATPGQAERFKSAGVVAYLTKPLDVAEFLRVLDMALAEAVA